MVENVIQVLARLYVVASNINFLVGIVILNLLTFRVLSNKTAKIANINVLKGINANNRRISKRLKSIDNIIDKITISDKKLQGFILINKKYY